MTNKTVKKQSRLPGDPPKTVYVAMSGGVDSSVAAALLKRQGYTVVGVFMKPWSPPDEQAATCPWHRDREDALRVASVLDIPLLTWDFSEAYGSAVTDYMVETYRRGNTPNPDVMCNKEIKFGLFFRKAVEEGADAIATGHYARIRATRAGPVLAKALDENKDQTYFLWMLTQPQLERTLFPIGDYAKPDVRKLAKRFGLPVFDKKDSQGVCFVGPMDVKEFLKRRIKPKEGSIRSLDGRELGWHDGAAYYTIGQRHGLGISAGGGPYYVVAKDMKKNIIYVGSEQDLAGRSARIERISWVADAPELPIMLDVKIRYRAPSQRAILRRDGTLIFKRPQRAIAPGQSAVFYCGQRILGGGVLV